MSYRVTQRAKDVPKGKIVYYNNKIENEDGGDGDTAEGLNYISAPINTETEAIANIMIQSFNERLTDRNKDIVNLYIGGYRQKEIASIVGLSQAQVSRVLKRVREYMTVK